MKYLYFDVAIDGVGDGGYRVAVLDSPAGEGHEEARFPFDAEQLKDYLEAIRQSVARGRDQRDVLPVASNDLESDQKTATEFGQVLFDEFFARRVGTLYATSLAEARRSKD